MEYEKKSGADYLVRDEIEKIVKEKRIPKERFAEFSKNSWQDIVKKFHSIFLDRKKHPTYDLSYCWLHFREGLESSEPVSMRVNSDVYFDRVGELIPLEDRDKKLFLILSQGWVYEGHAEEILLVLSELFYLEDAYIVSPKFKWVICHCDDGECAVKSLVKK